MNSDPYKEFCAFLEDITSGNQPLTLDCKKLPDGLGNCGDQLLRLKKDVEAFREFSKALAEGDLEAPAPDRENALCWGLTALQAELRHLTWQAEQIAKGDYDQEVYFLGDFSKAFNQMTAKLRLREEEHYRELQKIRRQALENEEGMNALKNVMGWLDRSIVVMEEDSRDILFHNESMVRWSEDMPRFIDKLREQLCLYQREWGSSWKLEVEIEEQTTSLQVNSFPVVWSGKNAVLHVISNYDEHMDSQRRMEKEAYTDVMTGLYNRRFCLMQAERMKRSGNSFCVCFLDGDGLKMVNDTFGHYEGDLYIQRIAEAMRAAFRRDEVISRFGGDEFLVLSPDGDALAVRERASRINDILQGGEKEKPYWMGVCFGIEKASANDPRSVQQIIAEADRKMYRQKDGRSEKLV